MSSVHLRSDRLPPVPPVCSRMAHRLCLSLQVVAFSSSAAEKVPIPQFKGPTGPASMIDSLEMRTQVLKKQRRGGRKGGREKKGTRQQLSDNRAQAFMTRLLKERETGRKGLLRGEAYVDRYKVGDGSNG